LTDWTQILSRLTASLSFASVAELGHWDGGASSRDSEHLSRWSGGTSLQVIVLLGQTCLEDGSEAAKGRASIYWYELQQQA
jgi:hypothetical protein